MDYHRRGLSTLNDDRSKRRRQKRRQEGHWQRCGEWPQWRPSGARPCLGISFSVEEEVSQLKHDVINEKRDNKRRNVKISELEFKLEFLDFCVMLGDLI